MSDFYPHDDDDIDDGPSKSQIKREDEAMQAVGARLVQLGRANINGLPVNDTLRDALHEFKRISSREAQRRHLKRVGKRPLEMMARAGCFPGLGQGVAGQQPVNGVHPCC